MDARAVTCVCWTGLPVLLCVQSLEDGIAEAVRLYLLAIMELITNHNMTVPRFIEPLVETR